MTGKLQGSYIYYPRGYRRYQPDVAGVQRDGHTQLVEDASGHQSVISTGDPEVMELWDRYHNASYTVDTWDFIKCVLECAHRLMPNHAIFYKLQCDNKHLSDDNFNYLKEVEHYLTYGKARVLSPESAVAILDQFSSKITPIVKKRKSPTIDKSSISVDDPDTLRWIAIKEDTIETLKYLYVLFGK